MTTTQNFDGLSALQLETHIKSLGRLARLTSNLRDRLDETVQLLMLERRKANAAYKTATQGHVAWTLPVRLGRTKEQLTHSELADALGTTQSTVKKMVTDGRLPKPKRVQRKLVFSRSEINEWVNPSHATKSDSVPRKTIKGILHDDE